MGRERAEETGQRRRMPACPSLSIRMSDVMQKYITLQETDTTEWRVQKEIDPLLVEFADMLCD